MVQTPRETSWKLKGSFRLLARDSLLKSSSQRYAGLWISNNDERGWAERRDMSAKAFDNFWHRYRDRGYRLVSYDRYETANGTRYAGIWRQNSSRPDWDLKEDVDALVADQMTTGVPGMSVAVYQDGAPVYLRGFGRADIDDGIWMDSDHVGSVASVSKAVGGALTLRMVEQGLLDLDDATRDLVPTMPALHTHTGQRLRPRVEHRDRGRHPGRSQEWLVHRQPGLPAALPREGHLCCSAGQQP